VLALLLQGETVWLVPPFLRFVAGFLLVLTFFIGALLFTYWISKDE
jgi:hypothetical protein